MTDDPTLSARVQAKYRETAALKVEDMTLADRLTRRSFSRTITVDLGDEDGPIPVEIRVPTFGEINELLALQSGLKAASGGGDPREVAALMARLGAVAGGLCTDPSLDAAFWSSGIYPTDVIMDLAGKAVEAETERVEAARAFRQKAGGARSRAVRKGV